MTPDWYDLLGVPRDADTATIRAAWKSAVADLDPTDRTFRVYSQAAEVLLDEERRAVYDAQLAAERPEDESDTAGSERETDAPEGPRADAPEGPQADVPAGPQTGAAGDDELPVAETGPAAGWPAKLLARSGSTAAGSRRGVPTWLLAGVGLLALLVAGAALVMHVTAPNDPSLRAVMGEVAWWDEEDSVSGDAAVPPGAAGAQQAAEQAIGPLTAYDYQRLDESRDAALQVVTPDFAEQYEKLYEGAVRDNAVETQTVVTLKGVRASAVGPVEDDGKVHVLVFFDREVRNKALSNPRTFEDQATLVMEKVDDRWLVADLKTTLPPT